MVCSSLPGMLCELIQFISPSPQSKHPAGVTESNEEPAFLLWLLVGSWIRNRNGPVDKSSLYRRTSIRRTYAMVTIGRAES